jgi:predicted adenylyl cyclase CyaB
MPYEIEKRALLTKEKYDQLLQKFSHKREPEHKLMHTYLFREPKYVRVRAIEGQRDVIITKKTGTENKYARIEEEKRISVLEAKDYLSFLKTKGFKECAYVKTDRYSFNFDGINYEINDITHLGLILEVESITDDQTQVEQLSEKISEIIADLDLEELSLEDYQKMLDKMYAQAMIPIDNIEL